MQCHQCGWRFVAGGYTKEERDKVEAQQKKAHFKAHVKKVRSFADHEKSLHIQRDSHAAEIAHAFDEVAVRQTTTSMTFVDVPDASIASGAFSANEDHFVVVTAQADSEANSRGVGIQVVRGSTALADSEAYLDPPLATTSDIGHRLVYQWWGVINHTAAEEVKVQFRTSDDDTAAGIDLVTISVIKLSIDLEPGVDYLYQMVTANTTLVQDTDTATNNAEVSTIPEVHNNRWLSVSKARFGAGIPGTTAVNSRISRSGSLVNNVSFCQMEGENATESRYVMVQQRSDALPGVVSSIFTEKSKAVNTGTGTEGIGTVTRTHSGIFLLNLNKFESRNFQQDSGIEEWLSAVDYANLVFTRNLNPITQGDCFILAFMTYAPQVSGTNVRYWKARMQITDKDPQDLPTDSAPNNITTKAYKLAQWDAGDRIPIMYATMENLTTGNKKIDLDASVGEVGNLRGRDCISLSAFSMELSNSVARTFVCNDGTLSFADSDMIAVTGATRTFVENENLDMSETFSMAGSGGTPHPNLIQPANFVLRLSGGTSNTSGNSSIGGAMSTAAGGVVTSIMALWDPVGMTEATTGESEYRCIYIQNTHPVLPMRDVILWISPNTTAQDEIRIGVGSAQTNGTEPTVANENTAPSNVAFVIPDGPATPLHVGTIESGEIRSVWLKRIVPPNTPAMEANSYALRGRFHSDPLDSTPAEVDVNGIEYVQPLLADGYRLSYGNETWTFTQNFRQSDNSMRCNFHGVKNSVMCAGYFKCAAESGVGVTPVISPDSEEVSTELNGGPHTGAPTDPNFGSTTEPNSAWADNMDLSIVNMLGTTSRLRFEGSHPEYTPAEAPTTDDLPIGDIRTVWRGFIGMKINLDEDDDGVPDHVAFIGMVDIGGLDTNNKPVNNWVVTYKRIFTEAEIISISTADNTPIKSVFTPYVATIGFPELAENTIRIDFQPYADWTNPDPDLRPWKYVTCKEIFVTDA